MMQVLGIKRILMLVVLVAANAALAAATYLYVVPENNRLESELRSVRSQISTKRAEADRLRNEFEQIQEQKAYFEGLETAGFMSDQNRLVARRRIMNIQQYTKVLRAGYDISSADVVNNKIADEIGYVVLSSPISVDVEALDDVDFYNFIYWMENAFPGHVSVGSVNMERALDLNEATLRAIGSGTPTALIKGKVNFVWRTMVPEDEVRVSDGFGSEGF